MKLFDYYIICLLLIYIYNFFIWVSFPIVEGIGSFGIVISLLVKEININIYMIIMIFLYCL